MDLRIAAGGGDLATLMRLMQEGVDVNAATDVSAVTVRRLPILRPERLPCQILWKGTQTCLFSGFQHSAETH